MVTRTKLTLLLGIGCLAIVVVWCIPPIPQDPAYHSFADFRTLVGIPNFWNVATNLPFLIVGVFGLWELFRGPVRGGMTELRANYGLFFLGLILTAFGSSYYHLAPSNQTLLWDRLPMAVSFMAFFSAVIGEHAGSALGRRLMAPLVVLGMLAVVYWYATELNGRGDLRPYLLVQFLPMLLLPLLLCGDRSHSSRSGYLWMVLAAYAVAKLLEWQDAAVLHAIGGLSGHSLKHVSAAGAGYVVLLALRRRDHRTASHRSVEQQRTLGRWRLRTRTR